MIAGIGIARGTGSLRPEAFPGRWNPRRAIPPDVEPAATAAALALERAGWWLPGSGNSCAGGLVVACDHASFIPSTRFARELRDGPASAAAPSGFLFALPSSAASVLGLLFGLVDYQATLAGGRLAGVQGLRHALDQLEMGRVKRVLLVALSAAGRQRAAVAWCLEPFSCGVRHRVRLDCGVVAAEGEATIVDSAEPFPAAGLLLQASEAAGRAREASRFAGGGGWISMEPKGEGSAACP